MLFQIKEEVQKKEEINLFLSLGIIELSTVFLKKIKFKYSPFVN